MIMSLRAKGIPFMKLANTDSSATTGGAPTPAPSTVGAIHVETSTRERWHHMQVLPGPKLPPFGPLACVPVTLALVGLRSMLIPPPSAATWSGKDPGVQGTPVRWGSLASVTAWHVVQ